MTIVERFGLVPLINAKGPATRLSGGIMRPEVAAAMVEASQICVDMAELQAIASARIAEATGAEAGYVASGAAACLTLATAACMTGLDPGAMSRLPDTRGLRNEVVIVRSQRNFYDHAVRAAGARLVEVGLPDRYAGAGVRDAETWEIEDAISERTAAVLYVADPLAQPSLPEVAAAAHARGVPVIVDAAAQLPPQANLRRFIAEGADLVAFSGGKVIGGPQASGFLCGRRDLIMAAALQHLDLDIFWDLWDPPPTLIDKHRLRGLPHTGVGRGCKVGKEEVVGLLTALDLFIAEGDAARHARWLADAYLIATALHGCKGVDAVVEGAEASHSVPVVQIRLNPPAPDARTLLLRLQSARPAIHLDPAHHHRGVVTANPICLREGEARLVGSAIRSAVMGP